MEYIYTAMLLHSAGKPINEANMSKVLTAADAKPDATKIKALIASLEGVDIKSVLAQAAQAPVAAAAPAAAKADKEDKKEETKKEEKAVSEEEAAAGLSALFG